MSTYAIIQLAGKQYRVQEGETLIVDRVEDQAGDTLKVNDVLLISHEGEQTWGEPLVKGASVSLKIMNNLKGDKIRVAKYKAKSRYRKVQGHRQHQTQLQVVKITR